MAGIIPKEQIEEVRVRADIVDVISAYVPLKRAGGSLKGLCPFHKEKTPSFNVDPRRQIFRCFGCDKGGDVFRFLMEYENVDFPTAVRLLADRVGVRIQADRSERRPEGPDKRTLLNVLEEAAQWYHQTLLNEAAAGAARAYLNERALQDTSVENFRIGYAPSQRGALLRWAKEKGFGQDLLLAVGLLAESDRGPEPYERFRDRLMFPICDEVGRVVGFSGRMMNPEVRAAKYVNSPETALFRKSNILFALDRAKNAMLEARTALLCEGQIDAIRCHEAGVLNAVATQGTALTASHARLLRRHADEVVIVLDADAAGEAAAVRSAEAFLEVGLAVQIAALPPGEDPDSLIVKQGAQAFQEVVAGAVSVIRFQVQRFERKGDLASDAGRQRAAKALIEVISHAENEVQKEMLIEEAARELGLLPAALRAGLARTRTPYSLERSTEVVARPEPTTVYPPEEIGLLDLLLHHPEVTPLVRDHLPIGHFTHPDCRQIADCLLAPESDGPDGLLRELDSRDADEACTQLAIRLQTDPSKVRGIEFSTEEAAKDTLLRLWRKYFEAERRRVQQEIRQAEGEARKQLLMESKQLTEDISRMRQGWALAEPILELSMPMPGSEG